MTGKILVSLATMQQWQVNSQAGRLVLEDDNKLREFYNKAPPIVLEKLPIIIREKEGKSFYSPNRKRWKPPKRKYRRWGP